MSIRNLFKSSLVLLVALALVACSSQSAGSVSTLAAPPTTKVNLNTASETDFLAIPNVGNRMVREFNEYRPYTSIAQFRREIGKYVDTAQVAAYEQYVFVPVDINSADADTLMQLPNVDATLAADLIAARPFASTADFLAKLSLSETDLAIAQSYLVTP